MAEYLNVNDAIVNFGFEYDDIAPTLEEFISFLKRQPTIAAVVVTRCKDCKYRDGTPGQPNIICSNMHDNDFCSYGEPREVK